MQYPRSGFEKPPGAATPADVGRRDPMTTTNPTEESSTDDEQSDLTTAGHEDDTEWKKHTDDLRAWCRSPLLDVMLDDRDGVENVSGNFEVHPTTPGTVRLSFQVDGAVDGAEVTIGGTEALTPEQADGLAAALEAAAEQARDGGADYGL